MSDSSNEAARSSRSRVAARKPQARGGHATRFTFPIRVYYEDTDAAGVVYYANYLRFMERARTEWLESLGHPLAAFEERYGVAFVVRRVEIEFLRPARLNDRLDVSVEALDRGASRLVVAQKIARDAAAIVEGRVTLACVDRVRLRPARIPASLAPLFPSAKVRPSHRTNDNRHKASEPA